MADAAGVLTVWEFDAGEQLRPLRGWSDPLSVLAVTPDARHALCRTADGSVLSFDLDGETPLSFVGERIDSVTAAAITPDGRIAITASENLDLSVWDLTQGHRLAVVRDRPSWFARLTRRHLLRPRHEVPRSPELERQQRSIRSVQVTPTGRYALAASHGGRVTGIDLRRRRTRAISGELPGGIQAWITALTADGWALASAYRADVKYGDHEEAETAASDDGEFQIQVVDLTGSAEPRMLRGHTSHVVALAALPDRRAVSASFGRVLRIWNLASGRELRRLRGHTAPILAVTTTSDGRRVVSVSARITRSASGRSIADGRLPRSTERIRCNSASSQATARPWG